MLLDVLKRFQQAVVWTPMEIKSSLMTSAYDVLDGPDTDPAVIFSQGAGHVRPDAAADPGLVYDAGWNDWLAFLCGTTSAVAPSRARPSRAPATRSTRATTTVPPSPSVPSRATRP